MNSLEAIKVGSYYTNTDYIVKNEKPLHKIMDKEMFLTANGSSDHVYGVRFEVGQEKGTFKFNVFLKWNKTVEVHKCNLLEDSFNSKDELSQGVYSFMNSIGAVVDKKSLISKITNLTSQCYVLTLASNNYTKTLNECIQEEKNESVIGGF